MTIKYGLWALGVLHLIFGGYALFAPASVASFMGFELQGAGAVGEVRAIFGGLVFAIGLAILRGAAGGVRGRQWLFAVALGYAGLFAGRVVSLAGDGPTAHTLLSMAVEGAFAGFLLFAAGQLGASAEGGGGAGVSQRGEDVAGGVRPKVGSGGPA